jgi:RNA polymerase sigma-70 factor (ECF subfamily)
MAGYALPAEFEERQVLASCRAGEHEGFDLLYRRYAPALVAFCEHRLGNVGDAEDAAHEAILKAHRAMPRFREGARLWPWLATIAANVCTDIQRSRERLTPVPDEVDWLAPEVDEDVSRRLRAPIVDAALDELPERFRTPLFLREFMGWSYEDIAGFSNKSIGSVRTTLMRARRAFQARVEDVARRRGQWPLPAAVVGGWRRLRSTLRSWRDSVSRATTDGAAVLWRADGLLSAVAPGVQMAVVAVVAAGALAAGPAGASTNDTTLATEPAASVALAPTTLASEPVADATSRTRAATSASVPRPSERMAVRPADQTPGPLEEIVEPTDVKVHEYEDEDGKPYCEASGDVVVAVVDIPVGSWVETDVPCPPSE